MPTPRSGSSCRSAATHFAGSRTSTRGSCTAPVTSSGGRPSTGGRFSIGEYEDITARVARVPRVAPLVPLGHRQRQRRVEHRGDDVHEGDLGDHPRPALRPPGVERALQQPTGRQPARHDPPPVHETVGQVVRDGGLVVEGVRLGLQVPVDPPAPAQLPAAARVADARTPRRGRAATAACATSRCRSRGRSSPRTRRTRTAGTAPCRPGRCRGAGRRRPAPAPRPGRRQQPLADVRVGVDPTARSGAARVRSPARQVDVAGAPAAPRTTPRPRSRRRRRSRRCVRAAPSRPASARRPGTRPAPRGTTRSTAAPSARSESDVAAGEGVDRVHPYRGVLGQRPESRSPGASAAGPGEGELRRAEVGDDEEAVGAVVRAEAGCVLDRVLHALLPGADQQRRPGQVRGRDQPLLARAPGDAAGSRPRRRYATPRARPRSARRPPGTPAGPAPGRSPARGARPGTGGTRRRGRCRGTRPSRSTTPRRSTCASRPRAGPPRSPGRGSAARTPRRPRGPPTRRAGDRPG